MGRKRLIKSNEHFYYLTCRSNFENSFYIPKIESWEIMQNELNHLKSELEIEVLAFVLLDNHFHLIARSPKHEMGHVMFYFMMRVTRKIQRRSRRINRILGGRYKGTLILCDDHLKDVTKYVLRSPIEANLCQTAELYFYTTVQLNECDWINMNTSFDLLHLESIRCGLKKTIFNYKKNNGTGRPISSTSRFMKSLLAPAYLPNKNPTCFSWEYDKF
jgi:REP element-mobilizing transposase RayT